MSNRIYLVTGAAGFLGSNICAQLLEKGEKVRALVLPNDKSVKYIPEEVEICLGDLCDVESLEKFFTIPEGMTKEDLLLSEKDTTETKAFMQNGNYGKKTVGFRY